MKNTMTIFAILSILLSSSAFASGSLTCRSIDGTIELAAITSSAGISVTKVHVNSKTLKPSEYAVSSVYVGHRALNILILDEIYDKQILRVEAVNDGSIAAGLAIVQNTTGGSDKNTKAIICNFSY